MAIEKAIIIPKNLFAQNDIIEQNSKLLNADYALDNLAYRFATSRGYSALDIRLKAPKEHDVNAIVINSRYNVPSSKFNLSIVVTYDNYLSTGTSFAATVTSLQKGANLILLNDTFSTVAQMDIIRFNITGLVLEDSDLDTNWKDVTGLDMVDDSRAWICENTNEKIHMINVNTLSSITGKQFLSTAIGGSVTDVQGVAAHKNNELWVIDANTNKIYLVQDDGTEVSSFLTTSVDASATSPRGIAYDKIGNTLWFVDTNTDKAYNTDISGTKLSEIDLTAVAAGFDPTDIAIDPETGNLLIPNDNDDKFYLITTAGFEVYNFAFSNISSDGFGANAVTYDFEDRLLIGNNPATATKLIFAFPNLGFNHIWAGAALQISDPEMPFDPNREEIISNRFISNSGTIVNNEIEHVFKILEWNLDFTDLTTQANLTTLRNNAIIEPAPFFYFHRPETDNNLGYLYHFDSVEFSQPYVRGNYKSSNLRAIANTIL